MGGWAVGCLSGAVGVAHVRVSLRLLLALGYDISAELLRLITVIAKDRPRRRAHDLIGYRSLERKYPSSPVELIPPFSHSFFF